MRYSTKQVKDSGIFPVFVGGGWGGGSVIIFGKFGGGVRANLPLLRGGVLCTISPCEANALKMQTKTFAILISNETAIVPKLVTLKACIHNYIYQQS